MSTALVIGLGQLLRGDDGAGLHAVERVAARRLPGVECLTCSGAAVDLLLHLRPERPTIILDAVITGTANPGTVHRWGREVVRGSGAATLSAHVFGALDALELAQHLEKLPQDLWVYGIEAADFTLGAPMSSAVRRGAEQAADRAAAELLAAAT